MTPNEKFVLKVKNKICLFLYMEMGKPDSLKK